MTEPMAAPPSVPAVPRCDPTTAEVTAAAAPATNAVADSDRAGRSAAGGVSGASDGAGARVVLLMMLPR